MTQEDKELLLKDLSARLPYEVILHVEDDSGNIIDEELDSINLQFNEINVEYHLFTDVIQPYLRPMSSMTAEEENFYYSCLDEMDGYKQTFPVIYQDKALSLLDWLNAHHFDYRGLIEKGLALKAPEGMYNIK